MNTANTKAEASWDISGASGLPVWARTRIERRLGSVVTAAASDTRSQAQNRELALDRLATALDATIVLGPRSNVRFLAELCRARGFRGPDWARRFDGGAERTYTSGADSCAVVRQHARVLEAGGR